MEFTVLYQSDEQHQKDIMGFSSDHELFHKFEEYVNDVQKYNFNTETIQISHFNNRPGFVPVTETVYLHKYLVPYFKNFQRKEKS